MVVSTEQTRFARSIVDWSEGTRMSDEATISERDGLHVEVPSFYVDSAAAKFSPYTYVLQLGVTDPSPESESDTIPLVQIIMSPHHAKALAFHLLASISAYEQANGTINVPGLRTELTLTGFDIQTITEDEAEDEQ